MKQIEDPEQNIDESNNQQLIERHSRLQKSFHELWDVQHSYICDLLNRNQTVHNQTKHISIILLL